MSRYLEAIKRKLDVAYSPYSEMNPMKSETLLMLRPCVTEAEPWDETAATALLKEYATIIAGLPAGSISWGGDVGLYPADQEKAIDAAANRHDMAGLRQAVSSFRDAARFLADENNRVKGIIRRAMNGTLRGSHRLPVRESQRGFLGKVILIVDTQVQAEVLSIHSPPETTTFYREEFAEFLRAIHDGQDVAGWMIAKRKFAGVTVQDEIRKNED